MPFNRFPFRRSVLAVAISLACATGTASAAVINLGDGCTLINAINNANANADTDGPKGCPTGSGADTINLSSHRIYQAKRVNNKIDGPNGLPSVSSVITINGNGSTVLRSGAEGIPNFRLFHVAEQGRLTLNSITLTNGRLQYHETVHCDENYLTCEADHFSYLGAGLFNKGNATLINTVVTGNLNIGGDGGGVANSGKLTLIGSMVSYNSSNFGLVHSRFFHNYPPFDYPTVKVGGYGGGIVNSNTGTAVLTGTTLSSNGASLGGGIANSGTLRLTNSTVSGNSVRGDYEFGYFGGDGGGILNKGKAVLTASTLSGNSSIYSISYERDDPYAGGISNRGSMLLKNVIIANSLLKNVSIDNSKHADCANTGDLQQLGVNLIEDGSCDATVSGDPKLGPLAYNGGFTPTHSLRQGSPAIDASNRCFVSTDQRGVTRPQPDGGRCDIGAYERIPVTADTVSPSVWPIVKFFRSQAADGNIMGTNSQAARQTAVVHQLVAAGNYRDNAHDAESCEQLSRLLQRIDTDNSPDNNDYVTGDGAAGLAEQISGLKANWKCP